MAGRRSASLLLSAALLAALAIAVPADAGKGGKGKKRKAGGTITRTFGTTALNQVIPDDQPGPFEGSLRATINAGGKKLKGRVIDDVNVSVRVTHPSIFDLTARVIAPNGAATFVVASSNGTSWGSGAADCTGSFLTFDDESPLELGGPNPAVGALSPPYAGRARPSNRPLSVMDGGPPAGTWELAILDSDQPDSGILHCWQVQVRMRAKTK